MRTLLRSIPTGLYFRDLENWTSNPDQAFDFGFMGRALKLVQKAGFKHMELVLYVKPQNTAGLSVQKPPFSLSWN